MTGNGELNVIVGFDLFLFFNVSSLSLKLKTMRLLPSFLTAQVNSTIGVRSQAERRIQKLQVRVVQPRHIKPTALGMS